jgi:hypothetical protein
MVSTDKIFGNFFDDRQIINSRFYNFCLDTLSKLTAANGGGDYTDLIDLITPLIEQFGTDIGDTDVALTIQKGKTQTNDQVMQTFGFTMKEKEGVIAAAVGGFDSAAYLEFYPQRFGEYTQCAKTQMPLLTNRVFAAATAHSVELGAPLTTLLTGFKAQWAGSRDAQMQQFGNVDDTRTERIDSRVALELGMLTVVHTIAAKFPGDVEACDNFFQFSLLFAHTVHRNKTFAGALAPLEIRVLLNHSLTDINTIQAQNPDDNAEWIVYIAHTAISQPDGLGRIVKPGRSSRPKPSDIGNLDNTFLLIKNMSDVNEGSFVVKVSGLEG